MKNEGISSRSLEDASLTQIEYERQSLLSQLKAHLASFEESNDLVERISNRFFCLEQELINLLTEKNCNEHRLKEENAYLREKNDQLIAENRRFRQLKTEENAQAELVKQFNEEMMKQEKTYHYVRSSDSPSEEEDLFYFYQNNLNEANLKIKQLKVVIREQKGIEVKLKAKDQQIESLCYDISEKSNENKLLSEQLSLFKKENSILYTNISLLKEEIKKVS